MTFSVAAESPRTTNGVALPLAGIDFKEVQALDAEYERLEKEEGQIQLFQKLNQPKTQLQLLVGALFLERRIFAASGPRDPRYFFTAGRLSYFGGEKEKAAWAFLNGSFFANLEAFRCSDPSGAVGKVAFMEKEFTPLEKLFWSLPVVTRKRLVSETIVLELKRKLGKPTKWLCDGSFSEVKARLDRELKGASSEPASESKERYLPDDVFEGFKQSYVEQFRKRFEKETPPPF